MCRLIAGHRASPECPWCGTERPVVFMVHDHIWEEAGLKLGPRQAGYWCLDCFERKLGRKVGYSDLKDDVACNFMLRFDDGTDHPKANRAIWGVKGVGVARKLDGLTLAHARAIVNKRSYVVKQNNWYS